VLTLLGMTHHLYRVPLSPVALFTWTAATPRPSPRRHWPHPRPPPPSPLSYVGRGTRGLR
jgi:hypothetical protein